MKKRLLVTLLMVIIATVIGALIYLLVSPTGNTNSSDLSDGNNLLETSEKPVIDDSVDGLEIDLVDSVVYQLDGLDFNFVIAKIRVKSKNETINVPVSNFVTNQNVNLGDVDNYINQLEANNLFLGKQNVWYELVSGKNEFIGNIFIPYDDKSLKELTISWQENGQDLFQIDLKNKKGIAENLYYKADDIISDGKTYQMRINEAFEITGDTITRTYEDGYSEEFLYSSTAQVYAFKVEAVSLWGDEVVIEDAIYQVDGRDDYFEALNSQFKSMKYDNIIGKVVKDKGAGTLLFITLNPEHQPITYKGKLKLKLKDKQEWITINVNL